MRLTVLGGSGGMEVTATEINTGYLVTSGGAALLMDCGPGVATQLSRHIALNSLVGVIVSHMHFNNFYDLLPLAIQLSIHNADVLMRDYGDLIARDWREPLPVYLPPQGAQWLTRIADFMGNEGPYPERRNWTRFQTTFDLHTFAPNVPFAVGPFTVEVVGPVAHGPGPCFGLRVVGGMSVIGYTGDSGMCEALDDIARDADLFLCDAMDLTSQIRGDGRHLSAEEAGQVAARAGAKHLMLTHIASNTLAWTEMLQAMARRHFAGPIHIAHHGKHFELSPHTSA